MQNGVTMCLIFKCNVGILIFIDSYCKYIKLRFTIKLCFTIYVRSYAYRIAGSISIAYVAMPRVSYSWHNIIDSILYVRSYEYAYRIAGVYKHPLKNSKVKN